jgi:hypothetical protein
MRNPDPVTKVDPETEAAIEETRRFLEEHINSSEWRADLPDHYDQALDAIEEILHDRCNLTEKTKFHVLSLLFEQLDKPGSNKPTRQCRDNFLYLAAEKLESRYLTSRNEATGQTESQSSIIAQALRRLDVRMTEKTIAEIIRKQRKIVDA